MLSTSTIEMPLLGRQSAPGSASGCEQPADPRRPIIVRAIVRIICGAVAHDDVTISLHAAEYREVLDEMPRPDLFSAGEGVVSWCRSGRGLFLLIRERSRGQMTPEPIGQLGLHRRLQDISGSRGADSGTVSLQPDRSARPACSPRSAVTKSG